MKFSVEFLCSLQTQHNNNCTRTGYRQTDRQRGARLLQGCSISDGDTRRVTVLLNTPHGNLISSLQSVLTGLSVFTARPSSSFLLHLPSSSSPSAAQQLVPCVLHWAVLDVNSPVNRQIVWLVTDAEPQDWQIQVQQCFEQLPLSQVNVGLDVCSDKVIRVSQHGSMGF